MPAISVVICIQDSARARFSIQSLLKVSSKSGQFEALIAVHPDQLTEDFSSLVEAVSRRVPIKLVEVSRPGRAAQMNAGIQRAGSSLILLLSDDIEMTAGLVDEHLQFHRDNPGDRHVAIGPVYFPPALRKRRFMRWLEDSGYLFGIPFTAKSNRFQSGFFYHANTSFKKALYLEAGAAWEVLPGDACDDQELGWRMERVGMRSELLPKAAGIHHHPIGIRDWFETMIHAGRAARLLHQRHPERRIWLGSRKRRTVPARGLNLLRLWAAWVLGMRGRERVYQAWIELGWLIGFRRLRRSS